MDANGAGGRDIGKELVIKKKQQKQKRVGITLEKTECCKRKHTACLAVKSIYRVMIHQTEKCSKQKHDTGIAVLGRHGEECVLSGR